MRPIYLFAHLPKTAGTSINVHLATALGERVLPHYPNNKQDALADPARFDASDLMIGHAVRRDTAAHFPGREPRFVVVLREPAAHVVSSYNFQWHKWKRGEARREPPDFDTWFKRNRNGQAKWLLGRFRGVDKDVVNSYDDKTLLREARDALRDFWLVGVTDDIEGSLAPLMRALNVAAPFQKHKNVSGRNFERVLERTPELDGRIRMSNAVDLMLYLEARFPAPARDAGAAV